jgi:PleD family two-component response regulator
VKVTASLGIAELDGHLPVEASLDRADQALYAAKAAGRNCARVWSADL